eukprot:8718644-Alexandrium_andersonii.AAC.1
MCRAARPARQSTGKARVENSARWGWEERPWQKTQPSARPVDASPQLRRRRSSKTQPSARPVAVSARPSPDGS